VEATKDAILPGRSLLRLDPTTLDATPNIDHSVVAAAVQGMDETVVNGAQLFYAVQFGIGGTSDRDTILVGLVNSAPYLCCTVLGCWLTAPLNHYLGRRGTIFVTAFLSFITCIWQGLTNSWPHLFVARFVLGLGIGPKVCHPS
jgi:MFS family permease